MLDDYDRLSWAPSVLQRLFIIDVGRTDWLNEGLELLIDLTKTPRGVKFR
jgi:hypothetical protein